MPSEMGPNAGAYYALHPNEIKFRKIGYFFFGSNQANNYQQRELKTVYLDSKCAFVKIVLHKCHPNEPNMFNQVGLVAASVYGEPLDAPKQEGPGHFQELEYESQFDKETLQRLRVLMRAREKAEI